MLSVLIFIYFLHPLLNYHRCWGDIQRLSLSLSFDYRLWGDWHNTSYVVVICLRWDKDKYYITDSLYKHTVHDAYIYYQV